MATNPRNAIISQIQSMAPELLKGVDVNALEDVYLNRMLDDAKRLSYGQRELAYNMANPERQYLFENPADYFQAYGTIPVNFQGTSGYYDTKEKAQDIRYLTPDANASYRLVSPKSGQVLGTGTGQQGLLDLATQANRLNTELGREADWQLVQTGPGGDQVIGTNKYNSDRTLLGKIFGPILDVGLPILGTALIPGAGLLGTILPAAAGSAVASAANDRSLQDALLRAAIAGAAAGVGEKLFAPAQAATQTAAQTAGQTAGQTVGQTAAQTATQKAAEEAAKKVGEEIVVTAIKEAAPSILGGSIGAGLGGGVGSTLFRPSQAYNAESYTPRQTATETVDPELTPETIVTANLGKAPTNILPAALATGTAASLAAAANAAGATANPAETRTGMTPGQMASVSGLPAGSGLLAGLTSNLGITDYLTLAGVAGSGIASLLGGGGTGAGTGTPYVSPFGAGGTFGNVAGRDMRAQPQIADYERYGFGPEATFFQPAYNTLVSGAAGTNPTATPTYRPLI